jgi:nicotinamide-nucleotide amidase
VTGATEDLARRVHAALLARGETLAVAESLTGGALGAALTEVPGVSATFRGAVVAYATELKASLLGVDPALLGRTGAVDPEVAGRMARGVRERLGATYGLATTGVAGPDPQDGRPPGEVHLAWAAPRGAGAGAAAVSALSLDLAGDRAAVRAEAVRRALLLALERLGGTGNATG